MGYPMDVCTIMVSIMDFRQFEVINQEFLELEHNVSVLLSGESKYNSEFTLIRNSHYTTEGSFDHMGFLKTILETISKLFRSFYKWITEIEVINLYLSRKAYMLGKSAIGSRGRNIKQSTVILDRLNRFLRVDHIYLKTSTKIESELKTLNKVCSVCYHDLPLAVTDTISKLSTTIHTVDKVSAMQNLIDSIPFSSIAAKMNMSQAEPSRWKGRNVLVSPSLMGGKSVFLLDKKGFIYADTLNTQFPYTASREFDTLSPIGVATIMPCVTDVLGTVSNKTNSTVLSKVRTAESSVKRYIEELAKNDSLSKTEFDFLRQSAMNLVHWLSNVIHPLGNDVVSISKAVIQYGSKSIEALE